MTVAKVKNQQAYHLLNELHLPQVLENGNKHHQYPLEIANVTLTNNPIQVILTAGLVLIAEAPPAKVHLVHALNVCDDEAYLF